MLVNILYGLLIALTISGQARADGQFQTPPFDSIACKTSHSIVQIQINQYRQTFGAGPAIVKSSGALWSGGWKWKAADEGTRLTGYIHLTIKADKQNGLGSFHLHTLYDLFGELRGGWLEMDGFSGSADCKIIN